MNCDNGELIRLMSNQQPPIGFKEVPKELAEEANRELGDKERVFVDMSKGTPLVKWANQNKTGRNEPCPCGSGRKYKKCCLGKEK